MTRRRGISDAVETIREIDPSAADALLYVEDLLVRVRGEARALANRIVAGATARRLDSPSSGVAGGPLEAVERLDEIRAGLQRIVLREAIE